MLHTLRRLLQLVRTHRLQPTIPEIGPKALAVAPAPAPPAVTIADVIERMVAIDAALPAGDGLACFNRMYLEVTRAVDSELQRGLFTDAAFVTHLDVVFANLYLAAVDSISGPRSAQPAAWQPLLTLRATPGIEPIQFALSPG